MKRSAFLKIALATPAAVVIAKEVAAKPEPVKVLEPVTPLKLDIAEIPDGMTLQEVMDQWKNNGMIMYQPYRETVLYCGKDAYKWLMKVCDEYRFSGVPKIEDRIASVHYYKGMPVKEAHNLPGNMMIKIKGSEIMDVINITNEQKIVSI